MGSAAAGKFQDHYKVLGVDPKASTDEIHAAYSKQIEQYHPQRGKSPDKEKYEAAQLAFEVLADPEGRKIFDSVRSGGEDEAECTFSGLSFFEDMKKDVDRRNVILIALYDHKRQKPRTPAITRRQLDMLISLTDEELNMAIWYLKDRGLMIVDDRSKMQITAAGMDYLLNNLPAPETVAPFLKLKKESPAPAVASVPPAGVNETVGVVREESVAPAPVETPPLANLATAVGASQALNVDPPAKPDNSATPTQTISLNIVRRPLKLSN